MNRLATVVALTLLSLPSLAHADINVDNKAAWSTLDAIDQFGLFYDGFDQTTSNFSYIADALDEKLTCLGHLGYALRCIKSENPVVWAMCQGDVEAFDAAKCGAEISADKKHRPDDREEAQFALGKATATFAEHDAQVKALFAKDPAYKKMFEIGAASRKEWAAKKNTALRDLTLAMDDARVTRSRRAMEGCEAKTWAAWTAAVSAIPAKRFSLAYKDSWGDLIEPAAAVILGEPDGYLAAIALAACLGNEDKPDIFVKHLQHALVFWPGYRGPRNQAQLAIIQANLTLDDRDAKVERPNTDRRELFTGNGNGGDTSSGGGGRAALVSLKTTGPKTHIVMAPTKSMETQCTDYRAGKRLSRIDASGRLIYEGTCYKYAQVMVTHSPPDPRDILNRYATGLKVGMTVMIVENTIMMAQANLASKVPAVVFGVAVK